MSTYETIVEQAGWTPAQQIAHLRAFVQQVGHEHTLVAVLGAACAAERVAAAIEPQLLTPRVMAACIDQRTDERMEFDATRWFAGASAGLLGRLIGDSFCRSRSADEVAEAVARDDARVAGYLAATSHFEVHLDPVAAWAWIDAHRPTVATDFADERACDLLGQARTDPERER